MKRKWPELKPLASKIIYSFIVILAIMVTGIYAYATVLPKYFSAQGTIDPTNLVDDSQNEERYGVFENKKINVLASNPTPSTLANGAVLGEKDKNEAENIEDEKVIKVDLTNQKLYAYEGDELIHEFTVSTGKWQKTPTGEFRIWTKIKSTKMSGGSKELGTYYYLPAVPHTMFFYNDEIEKSRGYGLHGAYWHNNFGNPMSHGCVNLKLDDAETLYYWANPELGDKTSIAATKDNPGTKIIIYGKAANY
jgi:lipoprotein-anchoring transpeptidase ErfK/SrfK